MALGEKDTAPGRLTVLSFLGSSLSLMPSDRVVLSCRAGENFSVVIIFRPPAAGYSLSNCFEGADYHGGTAIGAEKMGPPCLIIWLTPTDSLPLLPVERHNKPEIETRGNKERCKQNLSAVTRT